MTNWNCYLCKEYQSGIACAYCDDGSDFERMSNADRIRTMNDEELAQFLKNTVWQNGANLFDCKEYLQECCVGHCEQCNAYLKWLQSEVEQ